MVGPQAVSPQSVPGKVFSLQSPYTATVAAEQEFKFAVASLQTLRAVLRSLGASLKVEATLERNWVLDDAQGSLRQKGCLLRVRQWGKYHLLTYKGPARFSAGLKVREELEVGLEASEKALAILAALGFSPVFYYEKQRETWSLGGVEVALDHTPMGDFVELEGEGLKLRPVAAALGFAPEAALRGTYLELWKSYRQRHPEAPEHMVFS